VRVHDLDGERVTRVVQELDVVPETRLTVHVHHYAVGTDFETEIGARDDETDSR
jgi:hypothetical protein